MRVITAAVFVYAAFVLDVADIRGVDGASCSDFFPCSSNGVCQAGTSPATITCTCVSGYYGDHCQYSETVTACSSSPCGGNGLCDPVSTSSYVCVCHDGYYGDQCQKIQGLQCQSQPCANGGVCTVGLDVYTCICSAGYQGFNCQQRTDAVCPDSDCNSPYGECLVTSIGEHLCACNSGYSGDFCGDPPSAPQQTDVETTTTIDTGGIVGLVVTGGFVLVVAFGIVPFFLLRVGKRRFRTQRRQHVLQPATVSGQQQTAAGDAHTGQGSAGTSCISMVTHTVTPLAVAPPCYARGDDASGTLSSAADGPRSTGQQDPPLPTHQPGTLDREVFPGDAPAYGDTERLCP